MAYAFSRFKVGGRKALFAILLAQMLPPATLIIPLFLLMYHIKLTNSIIRVVISHLTVLLPLVTWFLIGFFDDVPRELEDAAQVDGCTQWETFFKTFSYPSFAQGWELPGCLPLFCPGNDMFYALKFDECQRPGHCRLALPAIGLSAVLKWDRCPRQSYWRSCQ